MRKMGKKTAILAAAALLAAALLNAGLWGGGVAHAAPDDVITFPDNNFKQALIDEGVDSDPADGQITEKEMAARTNLVISRPDVTDITGIRYAVGLQYLEISSTAITAIPAEISNLNQLTNLSIVNNANLGSGGLPSSLWTMTGLQQLNLYGNNLSTLPTGIGNLTNLTGLFLHRNNLTSLPAEIKNLTNLISLTVWENNLTALPSGIFDNMNQLSDVDVKDNYLDPQAGSADRAEIDVAIAHHASVIYQSQHTYAVTLNYNGGTGPSLPKPRYYYGESVTLPSATKPNQTFGGWDTDGNGSIDAAAGVAVQIAPNPVTAASVQFDAIYNYQVIFRTQSFGTIGGGIADIPYTLEIGQHIRAVTASVPAVSANSGYNFIGWYDGSMRVDVPDADHILDMDITSNKVFLAKYKAEGTIDFPDAGFAAALMNVADANHDGFITQAEMAVLTDISLPGGGITDITGIGYAVNLTSLGLSGNPITALPAEITGLTHLSTLRMSGCGLSALPAQVANLSGLTDLDLSNNRFAALPPALAGMSGLRVLNLSGNLLTSLPSGCLSGLTSLNLSNNYLNPNNPPAGLPSGTTLSPQRTYAISLDLNGGSGASLPKAGYWYNETIPLPQPIKAGYTFFGWDRNNDGAIDVPAGGTDKLSPAPPDAVSSAAYTAIYRSANAALSGIGLSSGAYLSPAFDPNVTSYAITLYDYVGTVTITPARFDGSASVAINSAPASGTSVTLANPGDETSVGITVTAEDGITTRTYQLHVVRAPVVSLDLSGISLSGVTASPAFTPSVTSYAALVPASTGGVTVSAASADGAASVSVNGAASGSTVAVEPGMSQVVSIVVSSPATTDRTRTYTVELKRGTTLSGFSAKPKVGKTYTLSPGGTNRLTFSYKMAGPGTVKIEIQKGTKWIALTTRTETSAGNKTWAWNGKVSGKYLAVGTYKARVTPSAFGMKSPASTISFKIVRYPSVAWKSVATKFRATGAVRTLCVFKVNNPTDAVVRVYNSKGKIVAVVKSVTNLLPTSSASVTWNGRATEGNTAKLKAGALVPTGSYTIRVAAGTKVYTKSIKITR